MTRARVAVFLTCALLGAGRLRAAEGPLPTAPPGTVSLPLGEYQQLLERAANPPLPAPAPPVPAVVSRAEVRARVSGGAVRGTVTLEGEVFRTGAVKVPLVSGATLLDARLAGRPLPLLLDKGEHAALLGGPLPFSLALDWGAPVETEPGRASFALPSCLSGIARLSLELPGDPVDVRIEPGLLTRRETRAGATLFEATLTPRAATRVSWSSRDTQPVSTSGEGRFLGTLNTLVTVGEVELRQAVIVDVEVLQGAPDFFTVRVPEGYEVAGVSGASVETGEERGRAVLVRVRPAGRHAFLLALERSVPAGVTQMPVELASLEGAQRESGEIAFEAAGTLELAVREPAGLRRMDPRECGAALRGLARQPLLAAFRYQRRPEHEPRLEIDARRYASAPVLAALAEHAAVTTLVTGEGRALTEFALTVRNHAQSFLRLALPEGATLLSSEVEGEAVKPARGGDGLRVPLLRTGFRPSDAYQVKFVYVQSGPPFARKGEASLRLPRIDLPVSRLDWELLLPDELKIGEIAGNATPSSLMGTVPEPSRRGMAGGVRFESGPPGLVHGTVKDPTGQLLSGAGVTVVDRDTHVERRTTTNATGEFWVPNVRPGEKAVKVELAGFRFSETLLRLPAGSAAALDVTLDLGQITETITVMAAGDTSAEPRQEKKAAPVQALSSNMVNLQRRAAGELPVRVEVPRGGYSYAFTRMLVLDEETAVRFRYKRR